MDEKPKFSYDKGRIKVDCPCGKRLGFKYEDGAKQGCSCGMAYGVEKRNVNVEQYYLITSYPPRSEAV